MWALGCVLYEICCLKVPFDAESLQDLILRILNENYDAIPRSVRNVCCYQVYGVTLHFVDELRLNHNFIISADLY